MRRGSSKRARRKSDPGAGWILLLAGTLLVAHAEDTAKTRLARVKDIASVEGVRDNQLIGYGIVVGLHGSGDSSQTVFPLQTLESALERMGSEPAGKRDGLDDADAQHGGGFPLRNAAALRRARQQGGRYGLRRAMRAASKAGFCCWRRSMDRTDRFTRRPRARWCWAATQ